MSRKIARRAARLIGSRRMSKEQYEKVLPPLRDALLAGRGVRGMGRR